MKNSNEAMREALAAFVKSVEWLCEGDESGKLKRQFGVLLSDARAALAEPPRNCELYNSKTEAETSFFEQEMNAKEPSNQILYWQMFANWLFATANEKGEADGE